MIKNSYFQRGFGLIEVLVTVLILGIGLLGLAGLQATSMTFNHSAYHRSQASILVSDMADRMRANTTAAASYAAPTAPLENKNCLALAGCSAVQMAQHDLFEWTTALANLLPSGTGTIAANGALYTISVTWDDRDGDTATFSVNIRP